jgi:hypothetical protein
VSRSTDGMSATGRTGILSSLIALQLTMLSPIKTAEPRRSAQYDADLLGKAQSEALRRTADNAPLALNAAVKRTSHVEVPIRRSEMPGEGVARSGSPVRRTLPCRACAPIGRTRQLRPARHSCWLRPPAARGRRCPAKVIRQQGECRSYCLSATACQTC